MKTKIIILYLAITTILFLLISSLWAADMVITIPTNDVPRVQEAFGQILNLGRPANITEVQRATTEWIHNTTLDYERRKDMAQFSPPPLEMKPSPTPTPTPGTLMVAPQSAPSPTATPKPKKK